MSTESARSLPEVRWPAGAEVPPDEDALHQRFKDIWTFCMIDHGEGTLPGGPCQECVVKYARTGPPDGRWNAPEEDA